MSFLKWAGGKSWLWNKAGLLFTTSKLPFVEPFIGGGNILISLLQYCDRHDLKREFYANDLNADLINTYIDVRDHIDDLIDSLTKIQLDEYYSIRDLYNKEPRSVLKSAMFIYLNKRCYRGLYRVNKKGEFNVPFGNYKNPIFDEDQLREISHLFNKYHVEFSSMDYEEFLKDKKGCQIYLDPPYVDTFNSYTSDGFDYNRFNEVISSLTQSNEILLSNNDKYNGPITEYITYTRSESLQCLPNVRRTERLYYKTLR